MNFVHSLYTVSQKCSAAHILHPVVSMVVEYVPVEHETHEVSAVATPATYPWPTSHVETECGRQAPVSSLFEYFPLSHAVHVESVKPFPAP